MRAAFERSVREEQLVTPEELQEAGGRRDSLWTLIKLKHVRSEPVPEDQAQGFSEELDDLAGAFEPALEKADLLADRRFDHAEASGRIAEIQRNIAEQERSLEQARAKVQ